MNFTKINTMKNKAMEKINVSDKDIKPYKSEYNSDKYFVSSFYIDKDSNNPFAIILKKQNEHNKGLYVIAVRLLSVEDNKPIRICKISDPLDNNKYIISEVDIEYDNDEYINKIDEKIDNGISYIHKITTIVKDENSKGRYKKETIFELNREDTKNKNVLNNEVKDSIKTKYDLYDTGIFK